MKKIGKMMFLIAAMSLVVCLYAGMTVCAEKATGKLSENCTWEFDTDAGTLTVTGAEIPRMTYPEFQQSDSWNEYEDQIRQVYLKGVQNSQPMYGLSYVQTASGQFGTITWKLDLGKQTLQIDGTGAVISAPWESICENFGSQQYEMILGDGITSVGSTGCSVHTLRAGQDTPTPTMAERTPSSPVRRIPISPLMKAACIPKISANSSTAPMEIPN